MELEFDVKVTPSVMYDYLLHHTYSGMAGIIGTVFGVFLIMAFIATKYPIYLIAGIVVIGHIDAQPRCCPYTTKYRQKALGKITQKCQRAA